MKWQKNNIQLMIVNVTRIRYFMEREMELTETHFEKIEILKIKE
jgi:hypothetical protein